MVLENLIIKEIGLSLDLFRRLVGECDEVILKKKEYLLRQGQVCSFIGFVETGVLRSYIEKEGEDYISDFHFQGSFATSYRSFLTIEASVGSIQALAYIIHSGFISGYQNRYGDNLKPPTNVYHRMTA